MPALLTSESTTPPDATALAKTHALHTFTIHPSTQISSRVVFILKTLAPTSPPEQTPGQQGHDDSTAAAAAASLPPLIMLSARAKNASKLISIVEIAKREIKALKGPNGNQKVQVWQYSALGSEVIEIPRDPPTEKKKEGAPAVGTAGGDGGAGVEQREGAGVEEAAEEDEDEEEEAFQVMAVREGKAARPGTGGMKKRRVPTLTVYLAAGEVKELRSLR